LPSEYQTSQIPCGARNSIATRPTVAQWADRETTPEEIARVKRRAAENDEIAAAMEMVDFGLKNVSADRHFAKSRRRGRQAT
jgi:hypothetical protein